jgi:peptidoglycan/LPS O-acetylase OafA/YrhL
VLHHAALEVPGGVLSAGAGLVRGLLRHGHFAVAVFIVLSGYCLMRPVASDPSRRVRGGVTAFLGRRARRILPPYYAALCLCWLLIALVPALQRPGRARWDRALPAFEPGVVAAHLALVHNLDERWIFKVDPPLWSVATEWQIYLLFPALLAVWRRHGGATTVAAGFALGCGVAALGGWLGNPALVQLCPWYAGLFALGMAGAVDDRWLPGRLPLLTGLITLGLSLTALAVRGGADLSVMATDLLVGAGATALIVRCSRIAARRDSTPRGVVLALLESRAAVRLGSFSYSLYLTHFPILAIAGLILRGRAWPAEARFWAMLLGGAAFCTVAAFAFHLAFERPSQRASRRDGISSGDAGDDGPLRRGGSRAPRRGSRGRRCRARSWLASRPA